MRRGLRLSPGAIWITTLLFAYLLFYFSLRRISPNSSSVEVQYLLIESRREYPLESQPFDSKLSTGTYDNGALSIFSRLFRPIEAVEVRLRFPIH